LKSEDISLIACGNQTWSDYSTNVIDYDYLPPARLRLRLRLLSTCPITITNKQNHNVIDYDYDYVESNHDYNHDYICLETSSERKQMPFAWFDVSIFSDNVRY